MPDTRQPITVQLDGGMVSNVDEVASSAPLESKDTRWRGGAPEGTVGVADNFSGTTTLSGANDTGAVALLPRGGEVGIATKGGPLTFHSRAGDISYAKSADGTNTSRRAQTWAPLGVTAGGVIYAGGDREIVRNVESCIMLSQGLSYMVSAVTVFQQNAYNALTGEIRVILRIQDPATGVSLADDQILATSDVSSGGDGACALGVMPGGSVWWGEYDSGTTVWDVKYVMVAVNAGTPSITVGAAVTAYSTTKRAALCAVTQNVEGTSTNIVFIGRNRDSDDRFEIVKWNTSTDSAVFTYAAGATYTMIVTANTYGCDLSGTIDICAHRGQVGVVARTAIGRVGLVAIDANDQTPRSQSIQALYSTAAIKTVGIAAADTAPAGNDEWLLVGTYEDLTTGFFANLTANFTKQRKVSIAHVYDGYFARRYDTLFHSEMALRPFSGYDAGLNIGDARGPSQVVPFLPTNKAPRQYHATDAPLGYMGYGAAAEGRARLLDSSVDICTWNFTQDAPGADEHRLHPCARIGVDRFMPHVSGYQSLWSERYAKPHSQDGDTFVLAYPADAHGMHDVARNARYAVVSTAEPPAVAESGAGITYVASGMLNTWDGSQMLESTPQWIPRLRGANGPAEALGPGATDLYMNAVYVFQDAAGNIHRSRPNSENCVFTPSGGAYLEIYVERPLAMLDGLALKPLGVELYVGLSATTMYQMVQPVTGHPRQPDVDTGGEWGWTNLISAQLPSDDDPIAWWLGLEQRPDALPACSDLAIVGDRLWVIKSESGRPAYSKPAVEGRVYEFNAANELIFNGPGKAKAVAELAGRPLFFTDRDAWTVYGDGPNGNGSGTFSLPQRVMHVGADDRRLVLKTPAGVIFKSQNGWFIVGPDYSPQPWGLEVQDLLNGTAEGTERPALTMTLREDIGEVLIARANSGNDSEVLAWQWESGKWSRRTDSVRHDLTYTDGNTYGLDGLGTGDVTVHHTMDDAPASSVTTPWLKPAGVEAPATFYEVIYTGRRLGVHDLVIECWDDYDIDNIAQTITYSEAEVTAAETGGGYITLRADLVLGHARAFKFRVSTTSPDNWRPSTLTTTVSARSGVQRREGGRK